MRLFQVKNTSTVFYHIVVIFVVAIWGSTLVSTKILIQAGMRPDEIFFVRFLLAYVGVWFFTHDRLWTDSLRDELLMVVLGITGGSLYFITENLAVGLTYVNNVSFIVSTSPIITMILVLMTYKGLKVRRILIVGTVLALLGVAVVIFNGEVVLKLNPKGDILSVVAALCWGVYCYLTKRLGDKYDSVFITRKVFAYGLLTALPILLYKPWQFPMAQMMQASVFVNVLFLGLIASLACMALFNISINKIGAVTCSNYVYFIPVATVIVSAMFLDEPMTVIAYVGSALILSGVFMANRGCRDDD